MAQIELDYLQVLFAVWFGFSKKRQSLSIGYMYLFISVHRSKFNFRVLSPARISLNASKTKSYLFGHRVSSRDSQSLLSISFFLLLLYSHFFVVIVFRYLFLPYYLSLLYLILSKLHRNPRGYFQPTAPVNGRVLQYSEFASVLSSTGHVNW